MFQYLNNIELFCPKCDHKFKDLNGVKSHLMGVHKLKGDQLNNILTQLNERIPKISDQVEEFDGVILFQKRKGIFTRDQCTHPQVTYSADELEITCVPCGAKLNPVQFLITHLERINYQNRNSRERLAMVRASEELLKEKSRTKCEHCKRMTAVNLPKPNANRVRELEVVIDQDLNKELGL